jgi:haloalkane dehalogenase
MTVLRTDDSRFQDLPDFDFTPHYQVIEDPDLGPLRMHYLDEGDEEAPAVLCLHGEPSWCYLYRHMIPVLVAGGFRVLAPDLVGFGRSDKPAGRQHYSYARHVAWVRAWLEALDLRGITLVAQDWGGLIGLNLVAAMPERFDRISLSNTGMPTGDEPENPAFLAWRGYSQKVEDFDAGVIVNMASQRELSDAEQAAYRAPFPDESFMAGARQFPMLVPVSPDNPAADGNREAWEQLARWDKPMLLCFSDADPVSAPWRQPFVDRVPGARGQPHRTLHGGHFVQEDDGRAWAEAIVGWG